MKSFVAFALVLTISVSGAVTLGQTPSQKANQSSANKPRTETLRVCQGVPIPEGYVIIAYMTSSACQHGAYLVKKQNDYENSLAVNGNAGQPDKESAESTKTAPAGSRRSTVPAGGRSTQMGRKSASQAKTASGPGAATARPSGDSASTSGASPSITRPRRVASQPQNSVPSSGVTQSSSMTKAQDMAQAPDTKSPDGPPILIGSQRAPGLRPPTLNNIGAKPAESPANSVADGVSAPGAEEVGEGDVLRVETSLVTVPVSVLDRQGRFVSSLQRDDFQIFEDGVEQSVAYFEPAEKPFTVALLLDMSASTHFHLWEIKEAAIEFAKQLRPQDRVLIVSFSDEVLLLTEVTNDLNIIQTVIDENANPGNSTRLYDAVDLTIRERLNKIKGRKAIVLFTDGVDTSSQQASYQSTLGEVDELDALIYPVQYDTSDYLAAMQGVGSGTVTVTTTRSGLFGRSTSQQTYNVPINNGLPIPGSTKADYDRADKYLHALADKTGGRLYKANDNAQLAQAFARIAEELRRQYSLGYYPKTGSDPGSERRQIKVRVRQPNLAVKARDSYVKPSSASPNK